MEGLLFGKRDQGFSLDGGVKAGVSQTRSTTNVRGYGNTLRIILMVLIPTAGTEPKPCYLSELGLNLNYAFTKNIAMTVGYELLYISCISLQCRKITIPAVSPCFIKAPGGLIFTF